MKIMVRRKERGSEHARSRHCWSKESELWGSREGKEGMRNVLSTDKYKSATVK